MGRARPHRVGRLDPDHAGRPPHGAPAPPVARREARPGDPRAGAGATLQQGRDPRILAAPRTLRRQSAGHQGREPRLVRARAAQPEPRRGSTAGRPAPGTRAPPSRPLRREGRRRARPRDRPRRGARARRARRGRSRAARARAGRPPRPSGAGLPRGRGSARGRPRRTLDAPRPRRWAAGRRRTPGAAACRALRPRRVGRLDRDRQRHRRGAGRCRHGGPTFGRARRRPRHGPGVPVSGVRFEALHLRTRVRERHRGARHRDRGQADALRCSRAGEFRPGLPGQRHGSACPADVAQPAGRRAARPGRAGAFPGPPRGGRHRDRAAASMPASHAAATSRPWSSVSAGSIPGRPHRAAGPWPTPSRLGP